MSSDPIVYSPPESGKFTVLSVWSGTQSYNVGIVAKYLEKVVVGLSPSFDRGIVEEELQGIIPVYHRY